jgi:hypothetical protein
MIAFADAQTAGALAEKIAAVNAQIVMVNQAIKDNAIVINGSLVVNGGSGQIVQQIATLTPDESTVVFNSMISILMARQAALQAELDAIQ